MFCFSSWETEYDENIPVKRESLMMQAIIIITRM
jgi:hypothetical protein